MTKSYTYWHAQNVSRWSQLVKDAKITGIELDHVTIQDVVDINHFMTIANEVGEFTFTIYSAFVIRESDLSHITVKEILYNTVKAVIEYEGEISDLHLEQIRTFSAIFGEHLCWLDFFDVCDYLGYPLPPRETVESFKNADKI